MCLCVFKCSTVQTTIFSATAKEKSYVFMANGLIASVHVCIFGERFGGFFSIPCMY